MASIPTLYEWIGGAERIEHLFDTFYGKVRQDEILAPAFASMPPEHFRIVAHFVSEVLGGPKLYSGDGEHSHSTMVENTWAAISPSVNAIAGSLCYSKPPTSSNSPTTPNSAPR